MSDAIPVQPVSGSGSGPGPRPPRGPLLGVLIAIGVLLLAVAVLLAIIVLRPVTTAASAPVAVPTSSSATTVQATPGQVTPSASATASGGASGGSGTAGSGTAGSGTAGGSGSSSGTGTGSGSGSKPTPTPTPTAVKKPLMQVFNLHTTVACVTGTDAVPAQLNFDITINWTARDTTAVYIGVDTADAVANPFEGPLPAFGSVVVPFSCYGPHSYSFAAVGADGSRDEGSVTVVNTGDPDPYAK